MKPMTFEKSVHTAVWGTESWDISAHASDPSVLVGDRARRTLRDMVPAFPLLFKVIDAKTRLSVQVHPNEKTVRVTGGEPKTEMWCALSDGPIYAGLREGTTMRDVRAAVASGQFEDLLVRHEARFGDVFFIPGGLVHAIGDGVKLYEVQQSSSTTFRLYDWGRVGADGRPRELHVEKGLAAIDFSLPAPTPVRTLETPYFNFSQMELRGELALAAPRGEFLALFTARGEVTVDGDVVPEGASMLIPPEAGCSVRGAGAHLLLTRFAGTIS